MIPPLTFMLIGDFGTAGAVGHCAKARAAAPAQTSRNAKRLFIESTLLSLDGVGQLSLTSPPELMTAVTFIMERGCRCGAGSQPARGRTTACRTWRGTGR